MSLFQGTPAVRRLTREDCLRYAAEARDPFRYANWEESQHPRDPDGQFSEQHGVRPGFHPLKRHVTGKDEAGKDTTEYRHGHGPALEKEFHERVKAMALPPAWTGVQVAADPDSDLQAVGYDEKGREQRVYSATHNNRAKAEKFLRVKAMVAELPKLDDKIKAVLGNGATPVEKDTAVAVLLIRRSGFRVGSKRDTGAKVQALGASTLTGKNVKVKGDEITFDFIGKKGVHIEQRIQDAELAALLKDRINDSKPLFQTDPGKVRGFVKAATGPAFKTKDLRTVVAAETALETIRDMKAPQGEKEFRKARLEVGRKVAAKLGNTASVALASYIPDEVFGQWQAKIS